MKRLLLIPAVLLLLFLAGRLLLPAGALRLFYRLDVFLVASLAAAACIAVARSFERGDHLRAAWALNGASYGFVLLGALVRIPEQTQAILIARGVLVIGANLLAIAAMSLFAKTYRVAGLELPGSPARKGLIVAGAVVLALLAAGHAVYLGVKGGLAGDVESWVGALSSAGDIVTFVLIAPVFMTALALRGGLLGWPWGYLVAANVAWLLFDAQDTLSHVVPEATGQLLEDYSESWRTLACALTVCAALAQRRLARGDESE